jgi:hypothetical protein
VATTALDWIRPVSAGNGRLAVEVNDGRNWHKLPFTSDDSSVGGWVALISKMIASAQWAYCQQTQGDLLSELEDLKGKARRHRRMAQELESLVKEYREHLGFSDEEDLTAQTELEMKLNQILCAHLGHDWGLDPDTDDPMEESCQRCNGQARALGFVRTAQGWVPPEAAGIESES